MPIMSIFVGDVQIGDRFRTADPKKVEQIANSFKRFGQLQPIIIKDKNELVDGLHRYQAAVMLGLEFLDCVVQEDIDEITKREIELEANIARLDMSWQQQQAAIAEIHRMREAKDPTWGQSQTAALLGERGQAAIGEALLLDKAMKVFPEIANAKTKTQALSMAKSKAKAILRKEDVKDKPELYAAIEERIWQGDSVELIKRVPDGSINAIITDPPFGIDYGSSDQANFIHAYEDSKESYERLLTMAPDLYRVLSDDGWLIWFLGITWYERVKVVFRDAGFLVDEIPIIWDRSDGPCVTAQPSLWFGRGYDIALHCAKGHPQLAKRGLPGIIRVPPVTGGEKLIAERPVELYAELIRRLTIPGELVADFFVGSGSSLAAAASLGRKYFGIELDGDRRNVAIKKVRAYTPEES